MGVHKSPIASLYYLSSKPIESSYSLLCCRKESSTNFLLISLGWECWYYKKNAEFCNDIMMLRDLSEHCENQKVNRFLILNQVSPNINFFIFLQENCPGTTFTTSVINTIIYPSFHDRSIKFIGFFYLVSQEPCHFYLCCLLKLYSLPTPTTTTLVQAINEKHL